MTRPNWHIACGAWLVCLMTAGVAELGGQQVTTPTAAAGPKTEPAAPKPANVKSVVERIQKRIDDEVTKPAAEHTSASSPRAARPKAEPALPPARRIHLVWRMALVWPQELTQ